MTPKWFRDLDEKSAGLFAAVAVAGDMMNKAADDPDKVDADLRAHLRDGARLVEQLGDANKTLIEFNRRSVSRFAVLSCLFTILLAANVVSLFFR